MRASTSTSRRSLYLAFIVLSLTIVTIFMVPSLPNRPVDAKASKVTNATTAAMQSTNPGVVGQWSSLIQFKTVPLHISLLPNGKLLYWGRDKIVRPNGEVEDIRGQSKTYVVDPQFFFNNPIGNTITFDNITTNLFCSGHSFLPDGRLLVTGGHDKNDNFPYSEGLGDRSVNFFDYRNASPWSRHSVGLALGRWYPFNVTMANGNVAIMGGSYWSNRSTPSATPDPDPNPGPERYTYDPLGGQGSLAMYVQDQNPFGQVENYPRIQLAPSGKILSLGVNNRYFDGTDTSTNPPQGHFTSYPFSWGSQSAGNSRYETSALFYEVTSDNGKVLIMGGSQGIGGSPVNEAHTNVTNVEQVFTPAGTMAFKRKFHTATILPDGKVMVSGGTQCPGGNNLTCPEFPTPTSGGAALKPELWDPANPGVWNSMAASPSGIPRLYHSMAILLPDATVLVGAGGLPGAAGEVADPLSGPGRAFGHPDAEVFSPPYLFNVDGTPAARPSITWIQDDKIGLGQSMLVKTPEFANINQVVLVRLGSVTHGFNQDQRRVVLNFSNNNLSYPGTLSVTMPPNGKVCPPGPYMMFLMSNGVPSVAKMVSIQVDPQVIDPLPFGSTVKSGPAVALNNDNRLQVFYRGGDDALYTIAQTSAGSATWTSPVSLGGAIFADPVVWRGNSGLLEVLVVGSGNVVYYNRQTSPGSASFVGFTPLSATAASNLVMHQNLDGRLQAFYRGTNNAVWTIAQQAIGSSSWSAQASLGGTTTDMPGVGRINGYLVEFHRGTDNLLYHSMQTALNTNTWNTVAAVAQPINIQSAPAVSNFNGDGQLIVFAKGEKSDLIFVKLSPPDKRINFEETLGGSIILSPGIGKNTDGHLDVFALGPDQKLYQNFQLKSGWGGFTQLGGSFSTPLDTSPVTGLNASGKLAVFVRSSDNSLYVATQNTAGVSNSYSGFTRITPLQ